MDARILRLNLAGQPLEWLSWQECACLYARNLVVWTLGGIVKKAYGGHSRISGEQSSIELPAIIACDGRRLAPIRHIPPLTNPALFYRDGCRCLYCGKTFPFSMLSRDHVMPTSRGGADRWENVVTSCKRCNQHKGDLLLSESDMELLALPYRPNAYEYLALMNSLRIRGDQMDYLRPKFSRYKGVRTASAQSEIDHSMSM